MHLERASSGQYHLRLTGEEWRVKTRHAPAWFKRGERGPTIAARPSPGYAASVAAGKFRDDYTGSLKAVVGDDPAELDKLHHEVRAWDKRMRSAS